MKDLSERTRTTLGAAGAFVVIVVAPLFLWGARVEGKNETLEVKLQASVQRIESVEKKQDDYGTTLLTIGHELGEIKGELKRIGRTQ